MYCPGQDTKTKVYREGPRSLLLPYLRPPPAGRASALLPLCQGPWGWQHTPRFHATAWSASLSARSQIVLSHTLCNMTSRRPKYAPGGGEQEIFQKPTWQPKSLCWIKRQSGFPPPAMWCWVTGGGGLPAERHQEEKSPQWQWKQGFGFIGCFGIFLDDIIITAPLL